MLIDDVAASRTLAVHPEHGTLLADLSAARRFSLSRPFAEAADEVNVSNPGSLAKILGLFKLPFPLCWFEVPQEFRPSFMRAGVIEGTHSGVRRVGVLMREDAGGIEMDLFWSFADGAVFGCPVSYAYRPGTNAFADLEHRLQVREQVAAKVPPGEVDSAMGVEQLFHDAHSRYRRTQMAKVMRPGADPAWRRQVMTGAVADWGGEMRYWIAALALVNSRNLYADREIDVAKANVARMKKGRPPLFTMRECVLSERTVARMREAAGTGEMRGHFVRGHFKARSSGIFWWSPFLRGNPALGFADKRYRID